MYMTGSEVVKLLRSLKLNTLKEVCKASNSANSYMHFSTVEGASSFFHSHVRDGFAINNMHFTVHTSMMPNGTVVAYRHRRLDFAPVANSNNANATSNSIMGNSSTSPANNVNNAPTTGANDLTEACIATNNNVVANSNTIMDSSNTSPVTNANNAPVTSVNDSTEACIAKSNNINANSNTSPITSTNDVPVTSANSSTERENNTTLRRSML